ncbi:hypothetical protein RB195_018102 [Necator americanus]|uniref:Endonuclease/exonuclease/phosphatase domain-containing protein n=1 Tax=Necator americanus TaxID=51031 RepID=A0ABR1CB31_NECAM
MVKLSSPWQGCLVWEGVFATPAYSLPQYPVHWALPSQTSYGMATTERRSNLRLLRTEYRIGRFGVGDRNENGNRLAGLLSAARLFHGNSVFMKKDYRRWTWESPNGATHAEIDHILTNRRWCLLDVSVVPSFCSCSDHGLLRAKIRLSHTMEKNICYRQRRRKEVVYDCVLEDSLSQGDWHIEEDPNVDYEMLLR